jgi:hypothetical protein
MQGSLIPNIEKQVWSFSVYAISSGKTVRSKEYLREVGCRPEGRHGENEKLKENFLADQVEEVVCCCDTFGIFVKLVKNFVRDPSQQVQRTVVP